MNIQINIRVSVSMNIRMQEVSMTPSGTAARSTIHQLHAIV
jgi:hypothetical protein